MVASRHGCLLQQLRLQKNIVKSFFCKLTNSKRCSCIDLIHPGNHFSVFLDLAQQDSVSFFNTSATLCSV